MSHRPFKVLQVSREHILVFQAKPNEDRMVLVDRVDEAMIEDEDERLSAVLQLHNRREVLNDIYQEWGPKPEREDDATRPYAASLKEEP